MWKHGYCYDRWDDKKYSFSDQIICSDLNVINLKMLVMNMA